MQRLFETLKEILADGVRRDVEDAELFQGVIDTVDWQAPITPIAPQMLPVVSDHLGDACALAPEGPVGDFAQALLDVSEQLHWWDVYERYAGEPDMDALRPNYACARFCGIGGMMENKHTLMAVSLQAPQIFYPSHVHKAPEGYVVVGGEAEWQRGSGDFHLKPSGTYFTHPSGVRHATRTLDQPLLCIAMWLGDLDSQVVIVRE